MTYLEDKDLDERIRKRLYSVLWAEQDMPFLTTYAGMDVNDSNSSKPIVDKMYEHGATDNMNDYGVSNVRANYTLRSDNVGKGSYGVGGHMPDSEMHEMDHFNMVHDGGRTPIRYVKPMTRERRPGTPLSFEKQMIKKLGGYVSDEQLKHFKLDEEAREALANVSKQLILHPLSKTDIMILKEVMEEPKIKGGAIGPILDAITKYGPLLLGLTGALTVTGSKLHQLAQEQKYDPIRYEKAKLDLAREQKLDPVRYEKAQLDLEKAKRASTKEFEELEDLSKKLKEKETSLVRRENLERGVPVEVRDLFKKISLNQ